MGYMKQEERKDLQSIEDVRQVVDAFYNGIEKDPLLGRYFAGLNMPDHLPRMYAFWDAVVFQTGAYQGRPFDAHLRLQGLAQEHFNRWIERFHNTVDRLYEGEAAQRMKDKASQIATIFQMKLGLLDFVNG
jgi:hemoglobin